MRILFVDGTPGFNPVAISSRPTGGICGSLATIPRLLAKKGHSVTVASCFPESKFLDGVSYMPNSAPVERKWDVVVFNRNIMSNGLLEHFPGALRVWWGHDLAQMAYMEDDSFAHIDVFVALSHYQASTYSCMYGLEADKICVIPNGVDKSVFKPPEKGVGRDRANFVIATDPGRGFAPMRAVCENLSRLSKSFRVSAYVKHGLHKKDIPQRELDAIDRLGKLPGVTILDPISQQELASVMQRCGAVIFPGSCPEQCSNLLLQAQACGCPVVSFRVGGNSDFIIDGVNGLLTSFAPSDYDVAIVEFTRCCGRLLTDDKLFATISENAPKGIFSWEEIADLWNKMLTAKVLAKR